MAEVKQQDNLNSNSFILIAGTSESPKSVEVADKKRDNGTFLHGITSDLHNMKEYVIQKEYHVLENIVYDMKHLSRETVLDRIKQTAQKSKNSISIYYTGHGEKDTGNWCFADGVVTLDQVVQAATQLWPMRHSSNAYTSISIVIISDCCFSGEWVLKLRRYENKKNGIYVDAACCPGKCAYDTKDGGMFTLAYTKKKDAKSFDKLQVCQGYLWGGGKHVIKYHNKGSYKPIF
eukprot:95392_1